MAVSYMTKEGYDKILAEINYLETVTSVIADRQYSIERENRRQKYAKDLAEENKLKYNMPDTTKWKFDFH